MSTKHIFKKRRHTDQAQIKKEWDLLIKKIAKSTKHIFKKRRQTVQARIKKEWYLLIKENAKKEGVTISKFIDLICQAYFGKKGWRRAKTINRK